MWEKKGGGRRTFPQPPGATRLRNPCGHASGNKYVSRGPSQPRSHHRSPQRQAARPGPARRPAYPPGAALRLRPARPRVTAPAALRRGAAAEARPGGLKPNPDRRPRGSARLGTARGEPGGRGVPCPGPCQRFPGGTRGSKPGRVAQRTPFARMGPSGWVRRPLLSLFIFGVCKSGVVECAVPPAAGQPGPASCGRRRARSYLPLLAPQKPPASPLATKRRCCVPFT
nr:translation initiation factor IF-2-like [Anser cygnoides]